MGTLSCEQKAVFHFYEQKDKKVVITPSRNFLNLPRFHSTSEANPHPNKTKPSIQLYN